MYRKIVWCYIIVLTLLDISLNTKLSAQGKSHGNGVSVHESLIEGITLQEWGSDELRDDGGGDGDGDGEGGVVSLAPARLSFGRRALAAAHALHVTVTNTHNETLHLASVAGTTPDFHASFFHSKVLGVGANTTFSVVYLGLRAGPARATLYIHTSKGVHKYPVSAEGVASEWRVWPLAGLRVPHNATLRPALTLYNPTDRPVQVTEVYSSAAWLGLALPDGAGAAPRDHWLLPPRASRDLVVLRLRLPPPRTAPAPAHPAPPLHAYIRIKGNMTGGALVVGVEAAPAPPGEYLSPAHIRLRTRGSRDRPEQFSILAGSTAEAGPGAGQGAGLEGRTRGRCAHAPPEDEPADNKATHNGGGAGASGVRVNVLRARIPPHQDLVHAADVTFDYAAMWAGHAGAASNGAGPGGVTGGGALYCAGAVTLGRALLPYSLRLLPGTLQPDPDELHFVLSSAAGRRARGCDLHNQFPEPLLVQHVQLPQTLHTHFIMESLTPLELAPGARGTACRLRLREGAGPGAGLGAGLRDELLLRTNLSDYTLPVLLYTGTFLLEWEDGAGGWRPVGDTLALGGVLAHGALAVSLRLRNTGPRALCLTALHADLPPPHRADVALHDNQRCAGAGAWLAARLEVAAGGAAGEVRGALAAHTAHGAATAALTARVLRGALTAEGVRLAGAAPHAPQEAPLRLEARLEAPQRVLRVRQDPRAPHDPALTFIPEADVEVVSGRVVVGRLRYDPGAACGRGAPFAPCATGLRPGDPAHDAWLRRGAEPGHAALEADAALQRERRAAFHERAFNVTLLLDTADLRALPVHVTGHAAWPRLRVLARGAPAPPLCAVGDCGAVLRLRVRNPSAAPLLLQPRLAARPLEPGEGGQAAWSAESFALDGWRAAAGAARDVLVNGSMYVVVAARAELELAVRLRPARAGPLHAHLYLRNNLTVLERVPLAARGALPALELGGRAPGAAAPPLALEVTRCGGGGGAGAARRTLTLRNTGRVALRLRDWRVSGQPCAARAVRLAPCAPLTLAPGEARALHVHYRADWTRTTTQATISVLVGDAPAQFHVVGVSGARLTGACAAGAARAPLEAALRWAGAALALLAAALAVALAAADAERLLRAHRAARPPAPPAPPAPLDLRALAAAPPPPPAPRPARRAPRPRRAPPQDPAAERRAFERWRAGVSRRAAALAEDEGRSSEEAPPSPPRAPSPSRSPSPSPSPSPPPPVALLPRGDAESSSPDSSPPPRDSYSGLCLRPAERASSGSESSSPASPPARGTRRAPRPPPAPPAPATTPRPARPHARKDRTTRRPAPAPPVTSPRRAAPAAPPPPPPPRAGARWPVAAASWSDVVSRGHAPAPAAAPLAPIGSDVPRRAQGSHSLFYYGGAQPGPWPPASGATPPPTAAPTAPDPPAPNEDGQLCSMPAAPGGPYLALESLWGAAPGAPWLWGSGAGAVRPPPGFPAPRPVRPYDPFQSLASIWTPAALDWRLDAGTPPPPPPPPAETDE